MELENIFKQFEKLPKMLKYETVVSLLAQKADSDRYYKTIESLTKYPQSQAIDLNNLDDFSIEDLIENEQDEFNDDPISEQKASLKSVNFDFLILLQDYSYELGEKGEEETELDFELENAKDLTYVKAKVSCKTIEQMNDLRANFFFKKGFVYKTIKIDTVDKGIEGLFHIYGVGPDEICLN
jgi:hypothetical protein